ncbi:MAG: adenylosuccinate synthase [Candidatus Faecousia sp.]|nr:adenylosuccinate synthase [Candidatus Faecousia sp.]
MGNCAIVGINWGDEGKGRMVDLLTQDYDVVVRYQGGGNAGHTVINEFGKFALHLLPSGIFRKGVVNILGNGVALDPENLWKEMQEVQAQGVALTPENLKISDRASLLMPWHRDLDGLEEARLADKKFGSTKQGIAPFYADKFSKKTVLAGELLYPEHLKAHLQDLLEWKNLTLTRVYGAEPVTMEALEAWLNDYCEKIKPYICDTGVFLRDAQAQGKKILFEAQLGALRDLDYGIHPYTTSSNPIAAYAPVGSGMPNVKIDEVVGVVKAYSSCVGEGPFTCELFGEEADKLREAGFEYGAKTGRPRRVGPIDIVATRYGVRCQGATNIALTKMDVMGYMDKIPVCVQYEVNGEKTDEFPFPCLLNDAKPVMEYLDGWKCDISSIRNWDDLPAEAKRYVEYIEEKIGCHIGYVSVGPERDSIILR